MNTCASPTTTTRNINIVPLFLTSAALRALKAELRVLVEAGAPQLGDIFGGRRQKGEAITAGGRGDLRKKSRHRLLNCSWRWDAFACSYLVFRLQPVRRELVLARLLPAAVGNHKAGNAQGSREAEAPHEHFVTGLPVLAHVLEDRTAGVRFLPRVRGAAERCVAATGDLECGEEAPSSTRKGHNAELQHIN